MLIKLKKNTLWSIFWEAPQQVSKERVGESEFLAAIAIVTNRGNVNKDEPPNIKVFTTILARKIQTYQNSSIWI